MKNKEIYLPIEFFSRELYAKILISSFFLNKNYTVYLGTKSSIDFLIRFKKYKSGTIVLKGGITKETLNIYKSKFQNIIILDEEIAPETKKFETLLRVSKELIKDSSMYVCSNRDTYNFLKKNIFYKKKIKFLGWPRFDLAKDIYKKIFLNDCLYIKKKYNNYLLFNSDFLYIDKKIITEQISKIIKVYRDHRIEESNIRKRIIEEKERFKKNFQEFKKFIEFFKMIAKKFQSYNFIIRTHPAEDYELFKKKFCNTKNIFVLPAHDDVYPYIHMAKGILHRGCTTGYQALLAKKHVAAILPDGIRNEHKNKKILFKNSYILKNITDIEKWIKKIKNKPRIVDKKFQKLLSMNYKSLSSLKLFNEINKLNDKKVHLSIINLGILKTLFSVRNLKHLIFYKKSTKNFSYLDNYNYKEIFENINHLSKKKIKINKLSRNLLIFKGI